MGKLAVRISGTSHGFRRMSTLDWVYLRGGTGKGLSMTDLGRLHGFPNASAADTKEIGDSSQKSEEMLPERQRKKKGFLFKGK
jgi:hypothetical protein